MRMRVKTSGTLLMNSIAAGPEYLRERFGELKQPTVKLGVNLAQRARTLGEERIRLPARLLRYIRGQKQKPRTLFSMDVVE